MKLLFLYGPPAVGKHTVGEEIAERTGYKLFHNHLTVDVVRVLYPTEHTEAIRHEASKLKGTLRVDFIKFAAQHDINLIFTLAYARGESDQLVYNIVKAVTDEGGSVCFVQLHAPHHVLCSRVGNTSRHLLGKPTTPEAARYDREGMDLPVLFTNNIRLDTSLLQPHEAAERVITHFHL